MMKNNMTRQKIVELRQELDTAKEIMVDNVEKLIKRAELIENIDQKTKDMREQTQAFPLASNDLKIKIRKRNHILTGSVVFGILGVSYGLINGHTKEGAAIGALIAGVPASLIGGALGYNFGVVSGFLERKWFQIQHMYRNFRPMQTLREKAYAWYYKDKMSASVEQAQDMLSRYKVDENKMDEKKVNESELDHSAILYNAKIIAHGFESKKHSQKQEGNKAEIKIAPAHPRARM